MARPKSREFRTVYYRPSQEHIDSMPAAEETIDLQEAIENLVDDDNFKLSFSWSDNYQRWSISLTDKDPKSVNGNVCLILNHTDLARGVTALNWIRDFCARNDMTWFSLSEQAKQDSW